MNKILQCLAIWPLLAMGAQASAMQPVIAQATLVIGQASIVHVDGQMSPLGRGADIRVGDRVQTELGGHVHLRFVDGARVSVRPSSRLQIDSYGYQEASTEKATKAEAGAGAIKFKLEEGVVRSITGEWGAAARDRFRLNTPVAAIGVKGTDFIVKATPDTTAATVFTGAISVAALQGACADSLGACQGGQLLSEDMKGQMIQLARLQAVPNLVPAVDLVVASLPQQLSTSGTERHVPNSDAGTLVATASKAWLTEARVATAAIDTLPGAAAEPRSQTLSWGRYPWGQVLSGDDFSQQIDSAMLQGHERVLGNGSYALFRPLENANTASYVPASGMAQFNLEHASASVIRGAAVPEHVAITSATLGVNFDARSFTTRLDVQGPQLGRDAIQASGSISAQGVMQSIHGNASVRGGLSADGREAGYLFQKDVPAGVLQGITLWGR